MLLKIMQIYIPGFIKKRKLYELFCLTSDAFNCELPELRGLNFERLLLKYALFTKEQAERCLQSGFQLNEIKQRLYQNSYLFGQNLKKSFNITTLEEAALLLETVYKLIGIDLNYKRQDEIIIKQCFFSKYYSEEVCKLISSLDEGLIAGLTGRRLCFYQRITEGCSCCKGYLGMIKK